MSCGVGCRHGSDLVLLWLGCVVGQRTPLQLNPLPEKFHMVPGGPKKKKKKKKKTKKRKWKGSENVKQGIDKTHLKGQVYRTWEDWIGGKDKK